MIYRLFHRNKCHGEYLKEQITQAGSIKEARRIANDNAKDEGRIWEDDCLVDCEKIEREGIPQILIVLKRNT